VIGARNTGFCHLNPPTLSYHRFVKVENDDRIEPREDHWLMLHMTDPRTMYPPVHPPSPGCSWHRFSLRTWLIWRESVNAEPVKLFKQEKIND